MPPMIRITDAALDQTKHLLAQRNKPSLGIRIGIKTRGCSGLAYYLEYVDQENPMDEKIEQDGFSIFIDPKATLFIVGTEMDYVDDKIQSGFVFRNPNEKGRCGCGESFHI